MTAPPPPLVTIGAGPASRGGALPLVTAIRPYAWGSPAAFPELFGTPATGEPQAELWAGAHPGAPSTVDGVPLGELIARDPAGMLGEPVVRAFGPVLPYLLKVLAVERPLSLQVHPTMAQARAGYAREQAAGPPVGDAARTYRDPFHKPEMVCALTGFHGLCGFRAPGDAAAVLEALGVAPGPDGERSDAAAQVRDWIAALRAVFQQMLDPGNPAVLAARAAIERALIDGPMAAGFDVYADLARACPGDPGVTAALLLNHVRLAPGQAVFLGAGVPHAYLGGVTVEIMANSDNVLRCGLTGKHVDVPELMRVVTFEPSPPHFVPAEPASPAASGRQIYRPPVEEFGLVHHALTGQEPHRLPGGVPQIVLCVEGEVAIEAARAVRLGAGQAAFVPASLTGARLTGRGTVYRAVPGLSLSPSPASPAPPASAPEGWRA
ncbi:mannose-6-phosphate isomerase, class I [Nonomuraea rubra]|uniref:mannose-6-phosphate isomerase n=1 Tax=Nonomuraea rubra TaxID=46180 RepID=A0A7X0NXW3_9ACTN|nr:mannose-6-phosphate isomerase, class I [Nonomuraea rubra]MBB6551630.1 mannose-6-phosphate isomerase [Nonomuraea rubra]